MNMIMYWFIIINDNKKTINSNSYCYICKKIMAKILIKTSVLYVGNQNAKIFMTTTNILCSNVMQNKTSNFHINMFSSDKNKFLAIFLCKIIHTHGDKQNK